MIPNQLANFACAQCMYGVWRLGALYISHIPEVLHDKVQSSTCCLHTIEPVCHVNQYCYTNMLSIYKFYKCVILH